jgi:hypothetical protein
MARPSRTASGASLLWLLLRLRLTHSHRHPHLDDRPIAAAALSRFARSAGCTAATVLCSAGLQQLAPPARKMTRKRKRKCPARTCMVHSCVRCVWFWQLTTDMQIRTTQLLYSYPSLLPFCCLISFFPIDGALLLIRSAYLALLLSFSLLLLSQVLEFFYCSDNVQFCYCIDYRKKIISLFFNCIFELHKIVG